VYACFFELFALAAFGAAFGFARSTFLAALTFDRSTSTFLALCCFGESGAACTLDPSEVSPHTFVLSFHVMPALLQSSLVSGWPEVSAALTSDAV
jgi:hypothetical protein